MTTLGLRLLRTNHSKLAMAARSGYISTIRLKHTDAFASASATSSPGQTRKALPTIASNHKSAPYRIVDTHESATQAIQRLQQAPFILIDGEGHYRQSFDSPSAGLSILQLGTPGATDVFLFDMLALTSTGRCSVICSLKEVLSNKDILKVGWGGREDLVLMKQAYGISVEPYLDMQLADIHGRIQRREGYEEQIKRLSSVALPAKEVRKLQIEGVHTLSKMDHAVNEHGIAAPSKESACLHSTFVS